MELKDLYDEKYQFIRELGQGGFGQVFLAEEKISERRVAIKELKDASPDKQQDIIREIQTISQFNRHHIVSYYHHFQQDGKLFLVMEYCPGGDLLQAQQQHHYQWQELIGFMKAVAYEMHEVHKKGIVHRDIKPNNLLLTGQGIVKITDFGIANTLGGTPPYMSPEALQGDLKTKTDRRVDIYALGVTMMELLTGRNPFKFRTGEQIIAIHDEGNFPIKNLPDWQQEVILKAIRKEPELRFQTMLEFAEALEAKHVPLVLNKEMVKAGNIAQEAENLLGRKKWRKAIGLLDHAENQYPESVHVLQLKGEYLMRTHQMREALSYYKKAISLNTRLDIQKELGSIYLSLKNYPTAISLLSDHLYRHPADLEAYNLLLQCYYETGRYEAGMDLAETILDEHGDQPCFLNNYRICNIMQCNGDGLARPKLECKYEHPFMDYNWSVLTEQNLSHNYFNKPLMTSKLLFMDYRFRDLEKHSLHLLDDGGADIDEEAMGSFLIPIGRKGYPKNKIQVPDGTAASRRHCLIINAKDDVWLLDLDSTGTYLNGECIANREQLIGVNEIKVANTTLRITTDREMLI